MSRSSQQRRLALAVASVLAAVPAAFGVDRNWNDPDGGLFQDPTHWTPEGVPEPGDVAIFDLRGNDYTVGFGADAAVGGIRVLSDTLAFELAGKTLTSSGPVWLGIGPNQSAHLTISDGVFQGQAITSVGGGTNSSASLTLDNRTRYNTGGFGVGTAGTLTIRDASEAVSSSLVVGFGSSSAPGGAPGSVTVTGPGSVLRSTGDTWIAQYGTASLNVLDGGRFVTNSAAVLARASGGSASVLVSGPGSTWQADNVIDSMFGPVNITVRDGGRIQSRGVGLNKPGEPFATGPSSTVLLSGPGTAWTNDPTVPFDMGQTGRASLTISDGAALSVGQGFFGAQYPSGSAYTAVRVSGAGSVLKASQPLFFTMGGRTSLTVENGGSVSATTLNYGSGSTAANISIDGDGSTITLSQQLQLFRHHVEITNGGTLSTVGASVGMPVQDSVTVRIRGVGSNWTSTGSGIFQVGHASGGAAEIHLEDGGQLTAPSLIITGNLTSAGLVSVSGPGSRLRVTPLTLNIGSQTNLPAELRVSDHGAVVASRIQIAAASRLLIDGGNVSTQGTSPIENGGVILHSGGTLASSTITNNGEIHLRAHDAIAAVGTLTNNRLLHGTGRVNGNLTNSPSGEIRVGRGDRMVFGNQLLAGAVSNAGRLTLMDDGAMEFNGTLTNAATGVISFSDGGALHAFGPPVTAGSLVKNAGNVLFSAGTGDFFPALQNNAGTSAVIVTGNGTATFHGPVAHDAGEFRVSDGSTAVFLAPVTGNGDFTGGGAKFFEAGQSTLAALATGGDTTVQAPASLSVARFSEDTLTVRGRLDAHDGAATNAVNSLSIEGDGVVDLANSDLLVNSDAATQAAVLATLEQYVASARNATAGQWKGPGLTSSAAVADPLTTLAVGTSGDDDVIARHTYNGDANLDGRINADDYFRIDQGFLAQPADPLFAHGDFNYDGRVNADDYFLIDQAFLGQGDVIAAGAISPVAAVPEPGMMTLLAIGGLVAMRRRR